MVRAIIEKVDSHFDGMVKQAGRWLDEHPGINTIVVIANHLFRAIAMFALMALLPGSFATQCLIMFGASLFYRITIERFCHFRFAIPACAGGMAIGLSIPAFANIVNGVAFQTLSSFGLSVLRLLPLVGYAVLIVWISHTAVQALSKKQTSVNCCSNSQS